MHYFKFNIGDYHKKAGRLSMLEHGAYTLLIHACYDRERFPTEEEALDWCWARTDDEVQAVKFVLRKFFEEQDGRFYQKRIEDEITNFHEKSEKNREIALKREADRRTKREEKNTKRGESSTKREPNAHEAPPNHKPRTKNQDKENKQKKVERPADVEAQVWDDFLKHRKRLRADLSETALKGIVREASKAGWKLEDALTECVSRGWRSFKADWVEQKQPQQRIDWE